MDQVVIQAELRNSADKAHNLRKKNLLPVEFYGKGEENLSLTVVYQDFRRVYRQAGENTIITLKVASGAEKNVLVQRIDKDPVSGDIIYAELKNVRMNEKVTANVPVKLTGNAPAVREMGGTLVQHLDELEIRCLPKDLIHEVEVSVDSLADFHHAIHVSDIKLEAKVEILTGAEQTIATVQAPQTDQDSDTNVDVSSVGVVNQKKEE